MKSYDVRALNDLSVDECVFLYRTSKDEALRSKIKTIVVAKMIPVVKKIASTIARRSTDPIEDMVQAGFIGLLKAIEKFSCKEDDRFKTYAGYLIIGEMKHYLRDKLKAIRVPAHIQELNIRINKFIMSLTEGELEQLTMGDIALSLNVKEHAVFFAMETDRRTNVVSLDGMYVQNDNAQGDFEDYVTIDNFKENEALKDTKIMLMDFINVLPDDEKKVIELYYNEDFTQQEIANSLGCNKMKVSRILKKAYAKLQNYLEINSSDLILEDF